MFTMSDADIESELKDDLKPLVNRIRRPMRRSERTRQRNRRVRFQKTRQLRKILLSVILIGVAIVVAGLIITTLRAQPKKSPKFMFPTTTVAPLNITDKGVTATIATVTANATAVLKITTAVPKTTIAEQKITTAEHKTTTAIQIPPSTSKGEPIKSTLSTAPANRNASATTAAPTLANVTNPQNSSPKTILLWNRTNRTEIRSWQLSWMPTFPKDLYSLGCKSSNCIVTDRLHKLPNQTLASFDAVAFYLPGDLHEYYQLNFPNETRNPNAYYIYASNEPYSDFTRPKAGDYYNITMTCRRDSDIVWRQFYVTTKENPTYVPGNSKNVTWLPIEKTFNNETENYQEYHAHLKKLTGLAVTIQDEPCNAKTKGNTLLTQMQKYMKIDKLGQCRNNTNSKFMDEYKFYLAFEEDLRQDCVTPFFDWAFFNRTVPVVFGGVDYKLLAPPHTYINARDFNSTKALTDYLLYLDAHPDKYLEYLYNFERYKSQAAPSPICELCKLLHQPRQKKIVKDEQFTSWQTEAFRKAILQSAVVLN